MNAPTSDSLAIPAPQEWNIYYADGEFARTMGDPLLGTVWATTKDEAERKGASLPRIATSVWAVEKTVEADDGL